MSSKNQSNYQDLIKFIAIFAMIIDHLGLYLFPEAPLMRLIGRVAMPVFCFFAGYNFKNKPNNFIIFFGLLLCAIHSLLFPDFVYVNILVSIYLGQCYLFLFQGTLKKLFYIGFVHVVILALLWDVTSNLFDYGSLAIAIMVLGYIAKQDHKYCKLSIFIAILLQTSHTLIVFNFLANYMVILLAIGEYLLMSFKDFHYRIRTNFNVITRNALYIYCVHLVIIEVIFYLRINHFLKF
jgi:hypothetical protein